MQTSNNMSIKTMLFPPRSSKYQNADRYAYSHAAARHSRDRTRAILALVRVRLDGKMAPPGTRGDNCADNAAAAASEGKRHGQFTHRHPHGSNSERFPCNIRGYQLEIGTESKYPAVNDENRGRNPRDGCAADNLEASVVDAGIWSSDHHAVNKNPERADCDGIVLDDFG